MIGMLEEGESLSRVEAGGSGFHEIANAEVCGKVLSASKEVKDEGGWVVWGRVSAPECVVLVVAHGRSDSMHQRGRE